MAARDDDCSRGLQVRCPCRCHRLIGWTTNCPYLHHISEGKLTRVPAKEKEGQCTADSGDPFPNWIVVSDILSVTIHLLPCKVP